MTPQIASIIQACQWEPSQFLIFSNNVFTPLIYYSHLGSIIPTIAIALFVFIKGKRDLPGQLLFMMTFVFSIWVFADMVLWATEFPSYVMFYWALEDMVEPFVYFFAFYFVFSYIFKKDFSLRQKIVFTAPLLPSVLFAASNLMLTGFDLTNCDRAADEGIIATYGYGIEILYTLLIIGFAIYAFIKIKEKNQRIQIILLTTGISLFLVSFSLGNIVQVFSQNWSIDQFNLFGAPVFVGFLAYLIIRFKAFKVRLIGAQTLVVGLFITVLSLLFVHDFMAIRHVVYATLVFVGVVGFLLVRGVYREIAQRERIQKLANDLEKANDKLKQLDQLKSEFLSVASHQLRAPITAIKGYVSNILEDSYGPVPDHLREPLGVVQESTRVMVSSIEDYLNVSRIEQGRMKYEMSSVDVTALAKRATEELTPIAKKKGLTIVFTESPTVSIEGDFGKIKQVFTNLIDNAIKYTEHGSITVSVVKDDTKKVVRFMSSDTGIGIPADEVGKLFSKFTRARDANKVNTTGTGLGLYVAKNLVEGHGGKVWAESDGTGKGSRFIVELPLVQPAQPNETAN